VQYDWLGIELEAPNSQNILFFLAWVLFNIDCQVWRKKKPFLTDGYNTLNMLSIFVH
jgi:hypothetical protein